MRHHLLVVSEKKIKMLKTPFVITHRGLNQIALYWWLCSVHLTEMVSATMRQTG